MKIHSIVAVLALFSVNIFCSDTHLKLQAFDNLVDYKEPSASFKSISAGVAAGVLSALTVRFVSDDQLPWPYNDIFQKSFLWCISSDYRSGLAESLAKSAEVNQFRHYYKSVMPQFLVLNRKLYSFSEKFEKIVVPCGVGLLTGIPIEKYVRRFSVTRDLHFKQSVFALQKSVISLAIMASIKQEKNQKILTYCKQIKFACQQIRDQDYFNKYVDHINYIENDVEKIKNGILLETCNIAALTLTLMGKWARRRFSISCVMNRKKADALIVDQIQKDSKNAKKWYMFAESHYNQWQQIFKASIKKYKEMTV